MGVKERIQQYIDKKRISVNSFENSINASNGYWRKTKSISANVVSDILRIYSDINPKARINIQIGTITLPTPRGTTAVNRLLPSFHAEIGVMHQALIAGEEGGIGKLIVTDKPICPYCGIDIKKLAIALQLDELIVYDMTGKYVFDGTKNEFNNIPPRKLIPRFKINDSTDQIQTQAVTHSAVTIGIFHNFKNLDLRIDVFNENTFV